MTPIRARVCRPWPGRRVHCAIRGADRRYQRSLPDTL